MAYPWLNDFQGDVFVTSKQKGALLTIGVAASLFLIAVLLPTGAIKIGLLIVAYLVIGWSVLQEAAINIFHGEIFDENFLMSVATIGALVIGEYPEAVAVMLLYQIGEWFQSYALGKSRQSIATLMDIRPDTAMWNATVKR